MNPNRTNDPSETNIHVKQTIGHSKPGATIVGVDTDDDSVNAHVVQIIDTVSPGSTVVGIVRRRDVEG